MKLIPNGGTAALVCLFIDKFKKLIWANCGDSRAVLSDYSGCPKALNDKHDTTNFRETKRVFNAGGIIVMGKVNYHLQITRCLGAFHFKTIKDKKWDE